MSAKHMLRSVLDMVSKEWKKEVRYVPSNMWNNKHESWSSKETLDNNTADNDINFECINAQYII